VNDFFDLFKNRVSELSSVRINLRDHGAKIKKVKRLATELRRQIDDLRTEGDLLGSVMVARDLAVAELELEERPLDIEDLTNWLSALERIERAFTAFRPADDYRSTIRAAMKIADKNGLAATIHDNSWFVGFLVALDERRPGLVFPPNTVPSGRCDYVRNSSRK